MKRTAPAIDQSMKLLEQACRDAGVKLTYQRMKIYEEVLRAKDHPDAESVFSRVRKRIPTISLDTVYRALWLFRDMGLVNVLNTSNDPARFDANLKKHHHFVCNDCGLTKDFYCNEIYELTLQTSVRKIGHPTTTHVEVRGTCLECAKKSKTNR